MGMIYKCHCDQCQWTAIVSAWFETLELAPDALVPSVDSPAPSPSTEIQNEPSDDFPQRWILKNPNFREIHYPFGHRVVESFGDSVSRATREARFIHSQLCVCKECRTLQWKATFHEVFPVRLLGLYFVLLAGAFTFWMWLGNDICFSTNLALLTLLPILSIQRWAFSRYLRHRYPQRHAVLDALNQCRHCQSRRLGSRVTRRPNRCPQCQQLTLATTYFATTD